MTEDFIKILEEMPLGLARKIKIGENDYALKMVKKMPGNEHATMESLHEHNIEMKGWDAGYEEAINRIKDWRNEQYLKLKNLK